MNWYVGKIKLMSKLKLGLTLFAIIGLLIFAGRKTSLAQATDNTQETPGVKVIKLAPKEYQLKSPGAGSANGTVLAAAICDDPFGICDALQSMFDSFGQSITSTITGAIAGISDAFAQKFTEFFWGTGGVFDTVTVKGYDWFFRNVNPTASADQQIPAPMASPFTLWGIVYKNLPDLHTQETFAYVLQNNILGMKVASAEIGRDRLNPIFSLWEAMRNVAYLLIVLSLVAYGFLVMVRYKIDPRTVATAQAVLPRLAIALILLTFSYTIAALVVDLMQVLLQVVMYFYEHQITALPPAASGLSVPFKGDPTQLWGSFFNTNFDIRLPKIGNDAFTAVANWVIQFILWYMVFSVFFSLIISYAKIFMLTIVGPIYIATGIIPSRGDSIRKWIFSLLAAAMVFPVIYFILNLAVYINQMTVPITLPDPLIAPNGSIAGFLILGLVQIATKVPNMMEELFDVVPGSHSGRGGVDIGAAARRTPFIGGFIG